MLLAIDAGEVNGRVLLAIAVVVAAARGAGWLINKLGQPRVHGEILAGIVLGPSALGVAWPGAVHYLFPAQVMPALQAVAQLGVVLFMFMIGLELDMTAIKNRSRGAAAISLTSIVVPAGLGALLALAIHGRLGGDVASWSFALFIGVAMAITAFPVLARVLKETGLYNTRIGVITITCAAIDDVVAWCLLALVVTAVKATGIEDALQTMALAVLFLIVMLRWVRPAIAAAYRRGMRIPVWFGIALALVCGWLTDRIGIHAIFGGFLAGVVLPREKVVQRELEQKLEPVVLTLLVPVFFVVVGLGTQINQLDSIYLWVITVVVTLVAIVGKLGGAMLAARVVGETWRDASVIGILMNTRGLTELVILTVANQLGIITPTVFTIMVIMALVTTLIATPLLTLVGQRHSVVPVEQRHEAVSDAA